MSLTARLITACSVLICLQPLTAAAESSTSQALAAGPVAPVNAQPGQVVVTTSREAVPIPGIVIVKLHPSTEKVIGYGPPRSASVFGLAALDATLRRHNVQRVERAFPTKTAPPTRSLPDLSKIYKLHFSAGTDADQLIETLNQNPYVAYAERAYMAYTNATPDDPLYLDGSQLHFERIAAAGAWDVQQGSDTVIVAIVDTGTDWDHEDLAANIWVNGDEIADNGIDDDNNGYEDDIRGWDFVDVPAWWPGEFQPADGEDGTEQDNDPDDFNGHGTHVAGIAAAVTNNGIGVASIGWNTTIMPVRAGYQGGGEGAVIIWGYEGILYAVENGAHIVSLSWGGPAFSQLEQDVIDYAWGMGTIIVAAAGNDGSTTRHFPSAYDHVLAVAATQTGNDALAWFSNYGPWVDICAPGITVLSTLPNDAYAYFSGTSMAAPMAAGTIALVKAQFPADTPHELLMRLAAGADNIDAVNTDKAGLLGYGRLNVYQALTGTTTAPGPNLTMTPSFSDGDGDGISEPGETVELTVALDNQFLGGPASNLNLVLSSDDYAVTLLNSQVAISGTIEPLASGSTPVPFTFSIAATAIPHRAVFTLEVTGDNGYLDLFTFSAPIGPAPILLVDDDDGGSNVESYYFQALDSLGMPFIYWSHNDQGTPAAILADYPTVIWFTEWAFPALDAVDRDALGSYLSGGGRLFLSGQDIGWDLSDPTGTEFLASGGASQAWYENYLHAHYVADDATPNGEATVQVSGVSGNVIGDGLAFSINQPGRPPEFQFPSVIEPLTGAEAIFQYPDGTYGATLWSGSHRVVNFAFGFEAITDAHTRFMTMDRTLEWLNDFTLRHASSAGTSSPAQGVEIMADVETSSQTVDSIAIYWSLDGEAPFNIEVMSHLTGRTYQGVIPAQNQGSTVYYFIYAMNGRNFYQTSPKGAPRNMHQYKVGPQIVLWEDFESGLNSWSVDDGWGLISPGHTGDFAITESPGGPYDNNQEYIIEAREGVNLNSRESVFLSFWHQYDVGLGDTAFVELTRDDVSWSVARTFTGTQVWEQARIPLSGYAGTEDIRFRFRFKSDGEQTADGWTVDDMILQLDTVLTATPIQSFALRQNYPNPFNLKTVIEYHLPGENDVSLTVYNIRGQVVRSLKDHRPEGIHSFTLNVTGLASGIYIYRLEAPGFSQARKMVILK